MIFCENCKKLENLQINSDTICADPFILRLIDAGIDVSCAMITFDRPPAKSPLIDLNTQKLIFRCFPTDSRQRTPSTELLMITSN